MTPLRVVSLLDAASVTGPAKNLFQLCRSARADTEGRPTEISIVTIRRIPSPGSKPTPDPFLEAAAAAGVEVDVLQERYRYDLRVADQFREIAKARGADVIESHAVRMHFVARYSGVAAKVPWVAFHHGYTAENLKMRIYNQFDRWSLRQAARIFTDCEPFADHVATYGIPRDRIRALSSSIEIREPATPEAIRAVREQLAIEDGESVILSIGRLSAEKAQANLIAAAAVLRQNRPDLKFRVVLVGDGPERIHLQDAANAAGLANLITFAGQQHDVRPYYAIATLFALPSLSEGSPNVLLEAMAAGVPIASTSVGGVPEMLENEWSGLLVPRANPEVLAKAMERLITDPKFARELARNAGIVVRERFSPEAYRKVVVQTYRELCSSSSRR